MTSLYPKGIDNPQDIFLINLGVVEAVLNFASLFDLVLGFIPSAVVKDVRLYIDIIHTTGIGPIYYSAIALITTDRLLNILLNLRYRIYCKDAKAKTLVVCLWVIGIFVSICFSVSSVLGGLDYNYIFFMYVIPTLTGIIIVLGATTYVFIFNKYRRSIQFSSRSSPRNQPSTYEVFRKSKFYIQNLSYFY